MHRQGNAPARCFNEGSRACQISAHDAYNQRCCSRGQQRAHGGLLSDFALTGPCDRAAMSTFLAAAPTARSAPVSVVTGAAAPTAPSGTGLKSAASSYTDLTEGLSARSSVADFDITNVAPTGDEADSDHACQAQLGYKDELEVRFIWDRVIGKGRHGTSTRVVIDRFTGQEYACKKMPKQVPRDLLPENATSEEKLDADAKQVEHIRREITLFTKLRSSLNVARLEQVYEDSQNVYLVMEKCEGPTLAEVSDEGPVKEADVSAYMRSVVRTIVQCHDEDESHAGVEPSKFMLLTEDRQSAVKATGFGRAGGLLNRLTNMAPEMLSKMPAGVGKNADTWAAGLMATRLLTEYFPFDDVLSKIVDNTGVLAPLAPVTSVLDENPLMPSGAALFVSSMVMLLDFSRPKWQPVTTQAKDFIVRCLDMDKDRRWSAAEALTHPWLQRLKPRTEASGVPSGIVQRIQRFGSFNEFKRAALEQIAERCLKQSMGLHATQAPAGASASADAATAATPEAAGGVGGAAASQKRSAEAAGRSVAISAGAGEAKVGEKAAASAMGSPAEAGGKVVHGFVGEGASLQKAQGLVEQMMASDGTIDRFTLGDGLAKLGYALPEPDLEHLLAQLSAVPGLTTSTAVTSASLAASQIDAAASLEEWKDMAAAAFNALDIDGDGRVHRDEMAALLAGRCPEDDIEEAVNQAIADAGLPATADSLDYEAFLRLLTADISPRASSHSMTKFPSMAQHDPWSVPSFSGMLKRACSTTLRRRSSTSCGANTVLPTVGNAGSSSESAGVGVVPGAVVPPLSDVVSGALEEEMASALPQPRGQARTRSLSGPGVPCMDSALAHAALQPVEEEAASAAPAVADSGFGGGGGVAACVVDIGGGGDGGRGGGRREIAGDSAWEGDEDDHLGRKGWDMSRLSKDRVRRMFPISPARIANPLDRVPESGSGHCGEESEEARARTHASDMHAALQ
eukprot:jgi/Ulvmu1/6491/UM003_0124.1